MKWESNPGDIGGLFLAPIVMGVFAAISLPIFGWLQNSLWLPLYWIGISLSVLGLTLLFIARLPLYRQRRFFAWGFRALPEGSRAYNRWAYGLIVPGIASLVLFLLLTVNLKNLERRDRYEPPQPPSFRPDV